MNETNLSNISDNTQMVTEDKTNEIEQPLKKSFKELLSLLGDGDSDNEDINNRENVKPLFEENGNDAILHEQDEKVENNVDDRKKAKGLSRMDKMKLASDTQRLIRENEDVQISYKPRQCKKFSDLKEMLAEMVAEKNKKTTKKKSGNDNDKEEEDRRNRHVPLLNNPTITTTKTIVESKEMNKENNNNTSNDMKETSNLDSEDDILPLRDRIAINIDSINLKPQVQRSLDTIMKEKYQNRNCLIQLKSREQYKEEKQISEGLLKKLRENLRPKSKEATHEIDLVVKERGGIHHHIHISDTTKCVRLAGEIDPLLSRGVKLSEEEEREWMGMSNKEKWKKHRSLLLAAEAEKRKAARDERIKEMNLRDEEKKKEVNSGQVKGNKELSDDDYEWKEEDATDTESCDDDDDDDNNESVTDRGESSNNEESDDDDDFGQKNDKQRSKKRIIGSDDEEEQIETSNYDNEAFPTCDQISSIVVDQELNFFDIPTANSNCQEELFSDSLVYNMTISSDQNKSQNSSCVTLSSEQPENNSDKSFYSSFSVNKSLNDTQPLDKCFNDTDITDRSADTFVKTLDDTLIIGKTLEDTLILEKTLNDTLILEKTLNDTLILEKTLDDTLILDKTVGRIEVEKTIPSKTITSTLNKEQLVPEAGGQEYFVGSVEMRSEHRKLFNFTSSTAVSSENPTQPSVKQTFSKLEELFKEDSEDNIDIDDVQLTDDDDEEEEEEEDDDDNSVDLDRTTPRKTNVSNVNISDEEVEEDENITDSDVSDSDNENHNKIEDYEGSLDAEDDEEEILRKQVVGIKTKAAKDFFDDEAELSGSDAEQFGPDENESDLDRYEEEEGDAEKLPSEGRLRRQIEKIHNRIEIDNDARDIRYLKELYLEDGDLHLGGEGPRKKRFTWAGINDNPDDYSQPGVDAGEDGDDDGGDNGDDFQTMELDQSLDKIDGKEEDENIIKLIEKYGKHSENRKWVPRNIDSQSEIRQAWQTTDNAKVAAINKSEQDSMITKNSGVVKKYGSFMSRENIVPPPPSAALNPSSSTKMSLKSRMQQHTFTVESKSTHQQQQQTNKRPQPSAGNYHDESDNLRMAGNSKRPKMN